MENFKDIINEIEGNAKNSINNVLVNSFNMYKTPIVLNSTLQLPKSKLFIKINENTSSLELNELKNGLRMFVKDDTVILADVRLYIKNTKNNIKYLTT